VTNEESLNALKVQLAVQIFPNEKVTIRPTEHTDRPLSRTELFSCQKENKIARYCHLYDKPARPEMRPIKTFLNMTFSKLN